MFCINDYVILTCPLSSLRGGGQDTGAHVGRAPPHSPFALQVLLFSPRIMKPVWQLYATTAPKLQLFPLTQPRSMLSGVEHLTGIQLISYGEGSHSPPIRHLSVAVVLSMKPSSHLQLTSVVLAYLGLLTESKIAWGKSGGRRQKFAMQRGASMPSGGAHTP